MREAGILSPLFSLPSRHGIGDLGASSYEFIDLLFQSKVHVWQILPLNPVGFGFSPYQPFSTYAGDPVYINLDELVKAGMLEDNVPLFQEDSTQVDYEAVRIFKEQYLRKAFAGFKMQNGDKEQAYLDFVAQAFWLKEYALFMVFKLRFGQKVWMDWPQEYQQWNTDRPLEASLQDEVAYVMFAQYLFFTQWIKLKTYANALNIKIMGDIPFYVGIDSADVWAHQSMFELVDGKAISIAGVPPDYFSATGQRWGNPIYHWDNMETDGYGFWIDRLRWNNELFDIIRLDHFRAFDTYWAIHPECPTAIDGEWKFGPAHKLMDKIYTEIEGIYLIAEDLGDLRPEVLELRDDYHLHGMKIIQFSLGDKNRDAGLEDDEHVIVYTGTHDNQTILGWYKSLPLKQKWNVWSHLRRRKIKGKGIVDRIVLFGLSTRAEYVIIPIQDLMEIDDQGRLNTPATIGSPNWQWRFTSYQPVIKRLIVFREMLRITHRE